MTKSRGINQPRTEWTKAQLRELRRRYPHERTTDIAKSLGIRLVIVYATANRLGLHKSQAFAASDRSGRILKGGKLSVATQFKKGHTSFNKGRKGWFAPGTEATRFKKGQRSVNTLPVGSLRLSKDGYLEQKYADRPGNPAQRWRSVHRLVWEKTNGPTPVSHVVVFKAGQKTAVLEEITIDKLELVSRRELMSRNTLHRYPLEIARAIQLRGALVRQINKRSKSENEDNRPA